MTATTARPRLALPMSPTSVSSGILCSPDQEQLWALSQLGQRHHAKVSPGGILHLPASYDDIDSRRRKVDGRLRDHSPHGLRFTGKRYSPR